MLIRLKNRGVLLIDGIDADKFLFRIITNSIKYNALTYSAILTPKGIIIVDFFIFSQAGKFLLDCNISCMDELIKLLRMYKLASKISIKYMDELVVFSSKNIIENALCCYPDPRLSVMGYRSLINKDFISNLLIDGDIDDYDYQRINNFLPEVPNDILPNTNYPFDYGLDLINCIDFNKGCYIGQEITCKMHYRKKHCKKLCIVKNDNLPKVNESLFFDGKEIGVMGSRVGNIGLALINNFSFFDENLSLDNNLSIDKIVNWDDV